MRREALLAQPGFFWLVLTTDEAPRITQNIAKLHTLFSTKRPVE